MRTLYTKTQANQKGFVSIVIALTVVIVLALITVAFAQLTRREQQNALNKQLASQATYAAESGINDAIQQLNTPGTKVSTDGKPDCGTAAYPTLTGDISTATGVKYTCLLVDIAPPSLVYSNVSSLQDRTVVFTTSTPLSNLTINWGSASNKLRQAGNIPLVSPSLPPADSWNYPAILQVLVVPFDAPGYGTDRGSLINNAFTTYLYPSQLGTNATNYAPGATGSTQGTFLSGACGVSLPSNPTPCKSSILFGAAMPATTKYLVHFLGYYDTANVKITGTDAGGGTVKFIGGQAVIDSTGKAQDVLKRLQVRVPLGTDAPSINWAIESQGICKQFDTFPGSISPNPTDC